MTPLKWNNESTFEEVICYEAGRQELRPTTLLFFSLFDPTGPVIYVFSRFYCIIDRFHVDGIPVAVSALCDLIINEFRHSTMKPISVMLGRNDVSEHNFLSR